MGKEDEVSQCSTKSRPTEKLTKFLSHCLAQVFVTEVLEKGLKWFFFPFLLSAPKKFLEPKSSDFVSYVVSSVFVRLKTPPNKRPIFKE